MKEEDGHHLSGEDATGVPFDPADYARNEAELSPDPDSGEEDSSTSGPRWIQWSKNHWRDVLACFAQMIFGIISMAR